MASNKIDASDACAAIREIWRLTALKALYAKMVIKNRILNVSEEMSAMGDVLHVKINPKPTVGDITANTGAFTTEEVSLTNVDLTVNKWKYVAHDVVDIAEIQSDIDLVENFTQAFVPALGVQIEQDIGLLWSSATTNPEIGSTTNGEAFGDDVILPAQLVIDNLDIDMDDRSWLLPPSGRNQLLKDDKFVDAQRTGMDKGAMTTGIFSDIYGVPSYTTTSIATNAGVRKALFLHRNGLMVAIQRNIKVEKFARTSFSTPFAASVLYGVAICRNNHTQVCNLKNTLV